MAKHQNLEKRKPGGFLLILRGILYEASWGKEKQKRVKVVVGPMNTNIMHRCGRRLVHRLNEAARCAARPWFHPYVKNTS